MLTITNGISRNEIINFFKNKYKNSFSYRIDYESKSDEALYNAYQIEQYKLKEMKAIRENGLLTYRINFDTSISKEIKQYMKDENMYLYNYEHGAITFNLRDTPDHCINNVPARFVEELEKHFNIQKDLSRYYIGKNDINNFEIGNKVKIIIHGLFDLKIEKGTVYDIVDDTLIIKKYRTRTKYFTFESGDQVEITKINNFTEV